MNKEEIKYNCMALFSTWLTFKEKPIPDKGNFWLIAYNKDDVVESKEFINSEDGGEILFNLIDTLKDRITHIDFLYINKNRVKEKVNTVNIS